MTGDDIMEQLALLREMTRTTGIIHEAQKLQLDYWIRIAVDDAIDHSIELQLEGLDKSLTYEVETKKKRKSKTYLEGLKAKLPFLNESVKMLLGQDVALRIKLDGKLMAEFEPNVSVNKKPR